MASRFSALADSDQESSGTAGDQSHEVAVPSANSGVGVGSAAGAAADDGDDAGYLDAFYHNHKPLRHMGSAAARRAQASRRSAQAAELTGSGTASQPLQVPDGPRAVEEQGADTGEEELDEDDLPGGASARAKRPSRKAQRRAARTHEKEEKRLLRVAACGCAETAATAGEDDGADVARSRPSNAVGGESMEIDEAGCEAAKPAGGQQGSVFDEAYRSLILKCPPGIAPLAGCKHTWEVARGFVPGMRAPARFFADEQVARLCLEEAAEARGGFLPAVQQLANVATLPGLMGCSLGLPDIHSGYGFAVGSVAAVNLEDPQAVVSPGGVGFDINCGVRLLRTELREAVVAGHRLAELASAIFKAVPSGVGAGGAYYPKNERELRDALQHGMKWALKRGLCWDEDLERTEEGGAMPDADPGAVSARALKRGFPQMGTLGSGNHYLELQVVDEIFDQEAARAMGLVEGCVCVMIHCGSRGLGHQLCTDYLQTMERDMRSQGISVPDRQLCCVRASSPQGQQYLRGMAAAANYAFVNRTIIAHSVREVFRQVLGKDPRTELGMQMVYDVAHNIAKREVHVDPADGRPKPALVHRKGATRSFPPGHDALPELYRSVGQPVLIGGSMGTSSYVLAGSAAAMELSFGSTCHGAGRRMSRAQSLRTLSSQAVMAKLRGQGIEVRVAPPKLVAEEADESYKDVSSVVRTCHEVGISRLVARMRPLAVIKG